MHASCNVAQTSCPSAFRSGQRAAGAFCSTRVLSCGCARRTLSWSSSASTLDGLGQSRVEPSELGLPPSWLCAFWSLLGVRVAPFISSPWARLGRVLYTPPNSKARRVKGQPRLSNFQSCFCAPLNRRPLPSPIAPTTQKLHVERSSPASFPRRHHVPRRYPGPSRRKHPHP